METVTKQKLSYSQVSQLHRCGEQFRLERRIRVPSTPSWAQPGGTVFHSFAENWERARHGEDPHIQPVDKPNRADWELALDVEAQSLIRDTDLTVEDIRPTGRTVKSGMSAGGGPNKKDREWWLTYLPSMFEAYKNWSQNNPWKLAYVPGEDGEPTLAVELHFEFEDARGDIVRGFIDQVRESPTGQLMVVDLKTGMEPYSVDQLGLYRIGLWRNFGTIADYGSFYLAGPGDQTSTVPASLTGYTEDRMDWEYGAAAEQIDRAEFIPNPGQQCSYCGVKDYCYVQQGEKSNTIPLPWPSFSAAMTSS